MPSDRDPDGEYSRFRANIQLGDGPDQRGDVTVELVREVAEDRSKRYVVVPDRVSDSKGAIDVEVEANDAQFGEFYLELMRARDVLAEALGLPDEEE